MIFSDEKGEGERWFSCTETAENPFFYLNWYIFSHACQLGMKKPKPLFERTKVLALDMDWGGCLANCGQ